MAERSSELESYNRTDIDAEIEDRTEDETTLELTDREDEFSPEEDTEETDKIREQIEETRQQMGETIDAIQEKLSFSNISEQVKEQVSEQIQTAKDAVYDATIGKAGNLMQTVTNNLKKSNLFNTITEMPVPFILIGLGTGLLIYNRYQQNSGTTYRYRGNGGDRRSASEASMLQSAKETVSGTLNSVSGAAGSAYDSVSGAANSAYQSVGQALTGAYEKAGSLKEKSVEQFDYYIEENPLAVGAVAAAVGAAVALSIPATSYENQLLGEASQNLLTKAEDAARGAFEKVQQVAGEVKKTIGDEMKDQL